MVTVSDLDDVDLVDWKYDDMNSGTVYLFYLFGDAEPVPMLLDLPTPEGRQVAELWAL